MNYNIYVKDYPNDHLIHDTQSKIEAERTVEILAEDGRKAYIVED